MVDHRQARVPREVELRVVQVLEVEDERALRGHVAVHLVELVVEKGVALVLAQPHLVRVGV